MTKLLAILFSLLSCPIVFSIIDWGSNINNSILTPLVIIGTIIITAFITTFLATSVISVWKYFALKNYIKKLKNKFKL